MLASKLLPEQEQQQMQQLTDLQQQKGFAGGQQQAAYVQVLFSIPMLLQLCISAQMAQYMLWYCGRFTFLLCCSCQCSVCLHCSIAACYTMQLPFCQGNALIACTLSLGCFCSV